MQRRRVLETIYLAGPLIILGLAALNLTGTLLVHAALEHGVREGVRYAATLGGAAPAPRADEIRHVVKANSFGLLNGEGADKLVQVHFYTDGGLTEIPHAADGTLVEVSVQDFPALARPTRAWERIGTAPPPALISRNR